MPIWSKFSNAELERRRKVSNAAMAHRDEQEWSAQYQEMCDKAYWKNGQCCAGCDHWQSDAGFIGFCSAAGIVSGEDVMRSMGISFSTYRFKPGFPSCRASDHCGKFEDSFDWSTLEADYLRTIGAVFNGKLQDKPTLTNQTSF